jgi:hypothetical protein
MTTPTAADNDISIAAGEGPLAESFEEHISSDFSEV